VYLQIEKKIKKLTASFGMRIERYEVDTAYTRGYIKIGKKEINDLRFQPVFRAGLNYQLFTYTFLRASYGQGYRFPSVAEKYISTGVSALKIYPNPVKSETVVSITSATDMKIKMQLIDNTGRTLVNRSATVRKGANNITIDLSNYSKGIYFIKLSGDYINEIRKVQKQ